MAQRSILRSDVAIDRRGARESRSKRLIVLTSEGVAPYDRIVRLAFAPSERSGGLSEAECMALSWHFIRLPKRVRAVNVDGAARWCVEGRPGCNHLHGCPTGEAGPQCALRNRACGLAPWSEKAVAIANLTSVMSACPIIE
jgi:hypothetical protein